MIFGINTTHDNFKIASNFTRLTAREITYNNLGISRVVFMPNITTNHAITNTNFFVCYGRKEGSHFARNLREFGVARSKKLEVNQ